MTFIHLHLLLNHIPTVGTIVAFGLLLLGFVKKSSELKQASLAAFFAIALVSLPTYMTGYSAQKAIKDHPGISETLIERHQSAALLALIFMEATGIVSWFGLWRDRKPSERADFNEALVLFLSVITIGLMASAANIGGEISHPEIGPPSEALTGILAPAALRSANIAKFQFTHPWAWPTLEALHFVGLSLLLGVVLVGNLRILGLMRTARFADVHQLLPYGMWGFVINAVTGVLFFIGQAGQYIENVAFHLKVLLILLAGANVLYLTMCKTMWASGPGDHAPLAAKILAASQVFLWIGVIYFGRMLPYIGNAF